MYWTLRIVPIGNVACSRLNFRNLALALRVQKAITNQGEQ